MSRRPVPAELRRMFRPRDDEAHGPHSVYRIYNADGVLMYIGVAREVGDRIYMHKAAPQSSWASGQMYQLIDYWTSQEYPSKAIAREVERQSIEAEAPLFNRQHNKTRWKRRGNEWVELLPNPLLADTA